jgi:selenium metabolism protein YedF
MAKLIDARGLACPEPVILTKKALDSDNEVTVLVDNATALENVRRLASVSGCAVETSEEAGGIFRIQIMKEQTETARCALPPESAWSRETQPLAQGPTVFVIASTSMGGGNDELGELLMKAFIHTAADLERLPDMMIFYNTGVKLATLDSGALDDLKSLEAKGVKILLCGTCVGFFELNDRIGVGTISNMFDIAGALSKAGRIVKP